jgi:hypothetical protein
MGYSTRYHATSLAAVFLALAIGILIGVGFGGDVLNSTKKDLEKSLTGDLEAARSHADELATQLDRSNEFAQRVYPVLVGHRLAGRRIGVVGLGALPNGISSDIEGALAPTGGKLTEVAVLREPPDAPGLAGDLQATRFAKIRQDPGLIEALGKSIGRQFVIGGPLLQKLRSRVLSRASGRFGGLDGLIVVRDQPANMSPHAKSQTDRIEAGILEGGVAAGIPVVGVETTDAATSSIPFFNGRATASVDDLDRASGQVAMVFSLLGAEGNFGEKDSADRLLPDLLAPSPRTPGG